jgi:glycosyltransferase involved in cell wall biosynthesis
LKLIFVNRYFHPDISATSQLVSALACDQAVRGREVHVVTSRQRYEDPAARLRSDEEHHGVQIHRVWSSRFGRGRLPGRAIDYLTFYFAAWLKLWSLASRNDIIVAKTDPPLLSIMAASVARTRGAHLVNWLQDLFPEVAQSLGFAIPFGGAIKWLRNRSLESAALNVAVGNLMASRVVRLVADPSKVLVIENWADGRLIRPIPAKQNPLRDEWGLGDRFVVGYSGNMGRAHEFDTILGACEELRTDPGVAFLFIGAGHQKPFIETEALRRSLSNVFYQPYQPLERLAQSLSVADVHLVTLRANLEGLIVPSKVYGVAAAGRAIVFVGDIDGEIARTVAREECGLAIPAGDSRRLAAAIRDLRARRRDVEEMGDRARKAFDAQFDSRIALEKWDRALRAASGSVTS